jgi:hypothetical protein
MFCQREWHSLMQAGMLEGVPSFSSFILAKGGGVLVDQFLYWGMCDNTIPPTHLPFYQHVWRSRNESLRSDCCLCAGSEYTHHLDALFKTEVLGFMQAVHVGVSEVVQFWGVDCVAYGEVYWWRTTCKGVHVEQIGKAFLFTNVLDRLRAAALLDIARLPAQEYTGIAPPGSNRYQTNSPSVAIQQAVAAFLAWLKPTSRRVGIPDDACVVLERFLHSTPGCPLQRLHADHSVAEGLLHHGSFLLALQENTRIRTLLHQTINIPVGGILLWPGSFVHGGHAYNEENYRVFGKLVGEKNAAKYNHSTYEELVYYEGEGDESESEGDEGESEGDESESEGEGDMTEREREK